jgi:hypothetical protein
MSIFRHHSRRSKDCNGWDQCGENLRKTADTPAINVGFMDLAEHTHLRATPRILKKKLEKMISTPKVTETITAATRRTTTTGLIAPNPGAVPHVKRIACDANANHQERGTGEQSLFQIEYSKSASQARILRHEGPRYAENLGEECEYGGLKPSKNGYSCVKKSVDI